MPSHNAYIIIFLVVFSCSKKSEKVTTLKEKNLETQMIEVYNQAMKEFERGDVIYAGQKFAEAELLYPQSIWAPRAVLMSAYGYFSQGYYKESKKEYIQSTLYFLLDCPTSPIHLELEVIFHLTS